MNGLSSAIQRRRVRKAGISNRSYRK